MTFVVHGGVPVCCENEVLDMDSTCTCLEHVVNKEYVV